MTTKTKIRCNKIREELPEVDDILDHYRSANGHVGDIATIIEQQNQDQDDDIYRNFLTLLRSDPELPKILSVLGLLQEYQGGHRATIDKCMRNVNVEKSTDKISDFNDLVKN